MEDFEEWQVALARIAAAENIVVKISALSSGAVPNFFTASIRRWVLTCFEHFGIRARPVRQQLAYGQPVHHLPAVVGLVPQAHRAVDAGRARGGVRHQRRARLPHLMPLTGWQSLLP